MEINGGSLDNIFQTALSERPGSCVSTVSAPPVVEMGPSSQTTRPDVLTSEHASPQVKRKKEKKKNLTNEADPPHRSMSECAGSTGGRYWLTPEEEKQQAEEEKVEEEDCKEDSWPDPADLVRLRYLNEKLALLNPLRYPLPDIFADRSVASQDSEAIIADLESRLGTWPPGFCTPPPRDKLTKEEVAAVVKEALESHRLNPLPPLSQAMRAALLKDPYTTSFTRLEPDPQDI